MLSQILPIVLVIEDSATHQLMYTRMLQRQARVLLAVSGDQAQLLAKNNPGIMAVIVDGFLYGDLPGPDVVRLLKRRLPLAQFFAASADRDMNYELVKAGCSRSFAVKVDAAIHVVNLLGAQPRNKP